MKISIHTDSQIDETEIQITCRHLTPQLERVISILRILDFKLLGEKDGEAHILDISKILYI
ncbi:LytTR family transcriptional regulator, partial [Romboutsia ilealis]|nr:LytTR family transcriptional regulator [Romboutsia ilealis]